jgi:TrmH family RNA methyltransferase
MNSDYPLNDDGLWSIKDIAGLSQRKNREKSHRILVEGKHPIEEALKAKLPIHQVFVLEGSSENSLPDMLCPVNPQEVDAKTMSRLADAQSPPPCLAVFSQPEALKSESLKSVEGLIVVLDEVQDPGNLGTLIRSSVAFGASAIVLMGNTVDNYNPKVIRASAGLQFALPIFKMSHETFTELANQNDAPVYITSSHVEETLYSVNFKKNCHIILGNEGNGIDPDFAESLSNAQYITIPMSPRVESLNVAICGSIVLAFAAAQQNLNTQEMPPL